MVGGDRCRRAGAVVFRPRDDQQMAVAEFVRLRPGRLVYVGRGVRVAALLSDRHRFSFGA